MTLSIARELAYGFCKAPRTNLEIFHRSLSIENGTLPSRGICVAHLHVAQRVVHISFVYESFEQAMSSFVTL